MTVRLFADSGRATSLLVLAVCALQLARPSPARAERWTDAGLGTSYELPAGWRLHNRPELPIFHHDATGLALSVSERESCTSKRSPTSRPDFADGGWTWAGQAPGARWELELCRPSKSGARLKLGAIVVVVFGPTGQTGIDQLTADQRSELTNVLPQFVAFAERFIEDAWADVMTKSFGPRSPTYTLVTTQNTPPGWESARGLLVHVRAGLVAKIARAGESTTTPCRLDNARMLPSLPAGVIGGWTNAGIGALGPAPALMLCRTYQQWSIPDNRAWGAEIRLYIASGIGEVNFEAPPPDVESAIGTLTSGIARDSNYRPESSVQPTAGNDATSVTAKAARLERGTDWGSVWESAHDVTLAIARSYSNIDGRRVDGGSLDIDIVKNLYASSYQEGVEVHLRVGGFGDEMAESDNRIEGFAGLVTSVRPKGRMLGFFSVGAAFDSVHHYGFGAAFYAKLGTVAYLTRLLRLEAAIQGFARTGPNQVRAMGAIVLWRLFIGGEVSSIGDIETSQFSVGLRLW